MPQRMQRKSLQRVTLLFLFLLAVLSASRAAHAQAQASATRTAELSAFGGYTNSDSDYGRFRNNGGTIGVDFTRFFGWRIAPSFEARASYTTGIELKQASMLFGLRVQGGFKRYHPYGDFLYGATKITFQFPPSPRYIQDTASTVSYGGGVDIDLVSHFQAKVDFQGEYMNFGPNGTQPNNADFSLGPTLLTVGVVYRIPIRPHNKQSDKH
jgi:hypothetical protein